MSVIKNKNYWIDENNNKWDCGYFSEEMANKLRKTLINCSGCSDCRDCRGCIDCSNCSGCRDCRDCRGCSDCSGCSNCRDCRGCSDCRDCRDCRGCSDCSGCRGCRDYTFNPQRIISGKIGSRNEQTIVYWNEKKENVQVICGCFKGDLNQFKEKVNKTHKVNEKYLNEYSKFIELVEYILKF